MASIRWVLSPSKFAGAAGCPCFEEDDSYGREYKDKGTDLHLYLEKEDKPLIEITDQEDRDMVSFCREKLAELRTLAGPFVIERKEQYIRKTESYPSCKLDWLALTEDGTLLVFDHKFGVMEVPPPEDNPQIRAYACIARLNFEEQNVKINRVLGGILHASSRTVSQYEFSLDELNTIQEEMKQANERVADPFKQPDPGDSSKCKRCMHVSRCPAVTTAVTEFVSRTNLLPMPEQFEPGALVSERDRIIAQDLAGILEAWAAQIKKNNREYAIQNEGTLGGVYNVTTRSNGIEVTDIRAFAEQLVQLGFFPDAASIFDFVKIRKADLVEALLSDPERDKGEVLETVKTLEEQCGTPRPPITVFRRGGKKQVKAAEEVLNVPQLINPWKEKKEE